RTREPGGVAWSRAGPPAGGSGAKNFFLGVLWNSSNATWSSCPIPSTPPTLPNFLENGLIPCRFRCVGGVIPRRATLKVHHQRTLSIEQFACSSGDESPRYFC